MSLSRRAAAAAVGAAAAALLATASPAAAQHPGANGSQTFFDPYETLWYGAGELHDPIDDCETPECIEDPTNNTSVVADGGTTWSPDGKVLFIRGQQAYLGEGLIRYVPAARTVKIIAAADEGARMSVSPDGTQVAVAQGGDVKVLDATTGALVRVLTPNLASTVETDPSWDPKNKGVAYTASDGIRIRPPQGGASRLWKKGVHQPDYSPDGSRIAYLTSTGTLQHADAATGTQVVSTGITVRGDGELALQQYTWSPDGKSFLFEGVHGCAVATVTGRVTARPLGLGNDCTAISWQPKR